MQIKELEQRSGLGRDTLRFYERRGLISAPVRGNNGYREYDSHTLAELKFVGVAKSVGFTLEEISVAIPKLRAPPAQCPELLASLQLRRQQVAQEMAALKRRAAKINQLIERFSAEPASLPASKK